MRRTLESLIKKDLSSKIVLLSGPRQVGKTTLSKSLFDSYDYLNFDRLPDRQRLIRESWDRKASLLIFDEIHKMRNWKRWLKGICDTDRKSHLLVTGSARLDTFKKAGDSLAGRYFEYRLLPLDLKELKQAGEYQPHEREATFEQLLNLSGFPEPFLSGSEAHYKRWRKTHLDAIIRQDLPELELVRRITDIETLFQLMHERVGSPLSHNSLREDLQTDDKSIKRWLLWLENSYALFKITPYSKKITRSLQKAPKYYFFDYPRIRDIGARLENLVALALYKEILFRNDTEGENYSLHYLQDRTQREVDFLIAKDGIPVSMIEVKLSDPNPSRNLEAFFPALKAQNPKLRRLQLVRNLERRFSTPEGVEIEPLLPWLEQLEF
jgi:predicted AAA+ superfamily ATPase